MEKSLVSIVIPTHNRKAKLLRLVNSILRGSYKNLEVIIVDDGSTDSSYEIIKKLFPRIKLIRMNEEKLSAFSRNEGMKNSNGKYIFFIDDDNIIDKDTINKLVNIMENDSSIQVVSPIMLYYNKPEIIWCAGGKLNKLLRPYHLFKDKNISCVTDKLITDVDYFPNAYMLRKETNIFNDAKIFPHNWAEIDLCLRIKRLGKLITCVEAKLWHDIPHNRTMTRFSISKTRDQARGRILFLKRYGNFYQKLFFWLILFPTSTLYYFSIIFLSRNSEIIKKNENRCQILRSYFIGTLEGIVY